MNDIKDRERFDNYEMQEEYDFSGGVRGRFYKPKKIPTTLRLDDDIILYFKKRASEEKVPYQTLINAFLRKRDTNSIAGQTTGQTLNFHFSD
jgi:predicted DNA binding CopG/RHH family protein